MNKTELKSIAESMVKSSFYSLDGERILSVASLCLLNERYGCDYRTNQFFGETGNTYWFGQYSDMPGKEIIPVLWNLVCTKYAEDVANSIKKGYIKTRCLEELKRKYIKAKDIYPELEPIENIGL